MDAPRPASSEMRYMVRPVAVPATSPVNPPQPVVRLQNMPRRNVPNNGARNKPCTSPTVGMPVISSREHERDRRVHVLLLLERLVPRRPPLSL
jgi:hypothetical protein